MDHNQSAEVERATEESSIELSATARAASQYALLEALPDPIRVIGRDYRTAFANTSARRVPGHNDRAQCCYQITHQAGAPCDGHEGCLLNEVFRTKAAQSALYGQHTDTGERRWTEVVASPIFDERGEIAQIVERCNDLTELKRREQRLQLGLEGARLGTWDWHIPTKTLAFNERWAEMLGYRLDELEPTVEMWRGLLHPDDEERVFQTLKDHLESKTEFYSAEHRFRSKSGDWVWVLDAGKVIERDRSGAPLRASGIHLDITPRKKAELALAESQLQLSATINSAPVALWAVDMDGTIILSEGKALASLGLKPGQLVGLSVFDVYSQAPEVEKLIRRGLAGEDITVEIEVDNVYWETRYVPRRDSDGKVIGVIGLSINVTPRKLAEEKQRKLDEKVREAQRLESLGVLAGGIAHDFNNLLVAIMGNAELALKKMSPVAPARERINEVVTASQRAADLAKQMLAYSGKGRFIVRSVDLSELVKEMAHILDVTISKSVVLRRDLSPELPDIKADLTQIRQIIMNLLTNASEAIGDESGSIIIRTGSVECDVGYFNDTLPGNEREAGTYVYLEVSDTGCGMDTSTKARVFDPFFTTKSTGRGLGLAATLGIISGHGGAIRVYSEPGAGTTFKLLFPAIVDANAKLAQRDETAIPRRSGLVLVVDDEETVRGLARAALEEMGFDVLTAEDGRQAVELYRQRGKEISLVLLDMTMPYMSGAETFRALQEQDPSVTVVLSSGYNEQTVTSELAGRGLAGFIGKPYRIDRLMEVITEALDRPKQDS